MACTHSQLTSMLHNRCSSQCFSNSTLSAPSSPSTEKGRNLHPVMKWNGCHYVIRASALQLYVRVMGVMGCLALRVYKADRSLLYAYDWCHGLPGASRVWCWSGTTLCLWLVSRVAWHFMCTRLIGHYFMLVITLDWSVGGQLLHVCMGCAYTRCIISTVYYAEADLRHLYIGAHVWRGWNSH